MDWTNLYKKYAGLWVALEDDEVTVITASENFQDVIKESKEKGFKDPIVTLVPKELIPIVG